MERVEIETTNLHSLALSWPFLGARPRPVPDPKSSAEDKKVIFETEDHKPQSEKDSSAELSERGDSGQFVSWVFFVVGDEGELAKFGLGVSMRSERRFLGWPLRGYRMFEMTYTHIR